MHYLLVYYWRAPVNPIPVIKRKMKLRILIFLFRKGNMNIKLIFFLIITISVLFFTYLRQLKF
jgi:hypothetical protein